MSNELNILALYGILILVLILVEVLFSVLQLGVPYMSSPRDDAREKAGIAGRANRAVINCGLGMALFAPAIFILEAKTAFSANTLLMAQTYLIARVIYAVVYLAGIPYLRTLAFVVSMFANLYLYYLAL